MRLSKIKLAGFKSFVDPTTIPFPSSMTGIVGPNGCGKSNVIDAVRWVMGESSAKHLRGDTMADVIFNGSSSRRPVGHASIELVFDNSDGSLGGEYAKYSEIGIKRQVGRDGHSSYFLNGTRCRRKDITGIFLGTGLGPRSYAVIEQGMISRVIEAKPEELRAFLEEAAGISKYKERRRETENRIRHTRDNLDRVNDLRDEMDKQLHHLDRQAKVAERYKRLKEDERLLKAQLLALRYGNADTYAKEQEARINETQTAYEEQVAGQRSIEAAIERQREAHNEATESFNAVQARYYSVGADIARLEQGIQHAKEKRQQTRTDLEEVEQSLQQAQNDLSADQRRVNELEETLRDSEPSLRETREVEAASGEARSRAEEAMQDWQIEWDEFTAEAAKPTREVEVERTRIQHLEEQLRLVGDRMARFEQQRSGLSPDGLVQEVAQLQAQLAGMEADAATVQEQLETSHREITVQREQIHERTQALDAQRGRAQALQGRLSSLEALQEAALGKRQENVINWLDARGLKDARRLAQGLEVDPAWEHAVETVLGYHLEAVCIDEMGDVVDHLASLEHGALGIIDRHAGAASSEADSPTTPLLSHVKSDLQLAALLHGVHTADSLEHALSLRDGLKAHESFITADGVWVGHNWLRVTREVDEHAGVLHREHELKALKDDIAELGDAISDGQSQLDEARERLQALEQERENIQQSLREAGRQQAEVQAGISARQASLEQVRRQSERLQSDVSEAQGQLQQGEQELAAARGRLEQASGAVEADESRRQALLTRREELRERLEEAREQARIDREKAHEVALRVESARTALDSTRNAMERIQQQINHLTARRDALSTVLSEGEAPVQVMEKELEEQLARRLEVEGELNTARSEMQNIENALQEAGRERSAAEEKVQEIRSRLEQVRMDFQAIDVRRQTIQEQIDESGFELKALFESLPQEADESGWEEQVDKMAARIQRLGPINLAAIDEHKELSERKQHMDAQFDDLTDALTTLENAIRKIDKETKARFKETFDRVNAKLQEMFPRLFGGGMARLELDSEDLLATGVHIIARPPGKRISSIHLMSGGEKALTAVALTFAIFELNPAPFCLLDEVDAPLDDANVSRFCDLVNEMSERVQFIFITHNKLTMETAHHLTGVTMQEPGVSRIVAVDVDEAAAMAAM